MDVADQLARAWAAVEIAGLPEHLHEVGFKAALNLQNSQHDHPLTQQVHVAPSATPLTPLPGPVAAGNDSAPRIGIDAADPFAVFEYETGIPREALEEVFYFHEGLPGLNGPARKLGASKSMQTKTIALALTAAYHFAVVDPADTVEAVRKECERLRCYDKVNFSTTLGATKGLNYTGPRNNKTLKTKSDTIAELKAVIAAIRKTEE